MFTYRLQSLLRYRKSLEETQQRRLAEANRALLHETNLVKQLEKKRRETMEWVARIIETRPGSNYLTIYDHYMSGLDLDITLGAQRADKVGRIVNTEREKLLELVKKRRTIELHRERLKERYDYDEARKERVANDEMTMARFILSEKKYGTA